MDVQVRIPSPDTVHYMARGTTADALIDSLNANGRWGHYDGEETYKFREERGKILNCEIRARCRIELPRWRDRSRAPSDLQKAFERCLREIKRHELGHHADFVREIDKLKRRLEALERPERRVFDRERDRARTQLLRLNRAWHRGPGHPARAHRILAALL